MLLLFLGRAGVRAHDQLHRRVFPLNSSSQRPYANEVMTPFLMASAESLWVDMGIKESEEV